MSESERSRSSDRIARARFSTNGDRHAFLESFRNYLALLARTRIDRQIRSKFSDSDLVQETMLQAHRDFEQFRGVGEAEFAGWLRAIMGRKQALFARRFYGAAARDPRLEVRLHDEFNESSQRLDQALTSLRPTPSEHCARRESAVLLADALAALPEHYREVVVLRHVEGLKMGEVAAAMGRSVDSVNKLWARAMIQLRESLREEA